jgi:hypothetical protein
MVSNNLLYIINRTEKDQMDWMDFAANGQQQSAVHYK